MVAGVLGSPLTDPLHLSLPLSAQNLCRRRKVVGRTSPEFCPAWVINQGFPEDSAPPTHPAACSPRASAGWSGGPGHAGPASPGIGAGVGPPPQPQRDGPA